jgi:hypothetical protein
MMRQLLGLALTGALIGSACTNEIVSWEDPLAAADGSIFELDPRQGFLPGGSALPPLRLDLVALGAVSGAELTIRSLGDYATWAEDPDWDGIERDSDLIALFIADGTAIAAQLPGGGTAPSMEQAVGRSASRDFPPTFFAKDVTVVIPETATLLLVGVPDGWYPDNVDKDDDFAVRISSR